MLYFAYGSNMCADRMARRCPAAREQGIARLAGWRVILNSRGVATLVPDAGSDCIGVLYTLTPACVMKLDGFEGVADGHYRRQHLPVGGREALVYLATCSLPGPPRPGYLDIILNAGRRRGFAEADLDRFRRLALPPHDGSVPG